MASSSLEDRLRALEGEVRVLRDREDIRQLKAKYCRYADGGWPEQGGTHRGPIHELFVEDGVWDASPGFAPARGREAIQKVFQDMQTIPFVMHNALTPSIEMNGDEAEATWNLISCCEMPQGSYLFLGQYHEKYVRTPEGWRYRLMRYLAIRQPSVFDWGTQPNQTDYLAKSVA